MASLPTRGNSPHTEGNPSALAAMKRNPTLLITSFLTLIALTAHTSCTYQEKYPGGDSSHSTIRLLPSE